MNGHLSTVPLMLFEGGFRRNGIRGQRLTYTDTELENMLASYQGTGSSSIKYGKELIGVYRVFEFYNKAIREE